MARKHGTRKRRRGSPYRPFGGPFAEIRRVVRRGTGALTFRTVTTSKDRAGRHARNRGWHF